MALKHRAESRGKREMGETQDCPRLHRGEKTQDTRNPAGRRIEVRHTSETVTWRIFDPGPERTFVFPKAESLAEVRRGLAEAVKLNATLPEDGNLLPYGTCQEQLVELMEMLKGDGSPVFPGGPKPGLQRGLGIREADFRKIRPGVGPGFSFSGDGISPVFGLSGEGEYPQGFSATTVPLDCTWMEVPYWRAVALACLAARLRARPADLARSLFGLVFGSCFMVLLE
jgi:hypothetical protein